VSETKEALAKAKWRSSGLTDAQAKVLRLKALTREESGRRAPKFADTASLLIPYFDEGGRPTTFYRLRRLEAPQGFAAVSGKVQRYAQGAGTAPEVYLPPLNRRAWRDVLADPKQPLLFTEGELKAACACARGFWCIGLGGVDSWRSRKKFIDLLEVLALANWTGRTVTIVYDSDAATNPDVMRAAHGLGGELRARGAEVHVASLPAAKDGAKQGLDDFLVNRGRDAFVSVLEDAEPLEEGDPLWKLNEEVVFVRDPGLVMVRETSQKLGPDPFQRHHYVNRRHQVIDADGKPKLVETAKEWLRWPHRFEVQRLTYEPGRPQIHEGSFNTWKGLGVEPEKGDVRPFVDLVEFVFDGLTKEQLRWFWQWMAWPLQNLGDKMYSCVAVWSPVHGVGKSLVAYVLKDVYGSNGHEIRNKDLGSSFNAYVENKQFIIGDEITGDDSRGFADQLKGLITQEEVRVNAKYVPEYTVTDRANWFFTSNHADAFYLDDSDRRFFVHHAKGQPRGRDFYKRIDRWRHREDGPARLLRHLLEEVDCRDFDPKGHAPVTAAKEAMQYDAKSEVARWVADLKNDPAKVLKVGEMPVRKDLFSPSELLAIFDPTGIKGVKANGLGRELVKAFARLPKNATSSHGSQNLYAVRNEKRWLDASPAERAKHWELGGGAAAFEPKKERRKY